MENPTDMQRKELLSQAKNIAVVGLSANPERTSYLIAEAMQRAGYRILPVNPMLEGTGSVLGERTYSSLREIEEPIDIVNVFRRSEFVPPVVEEAIAVGAKSIWMQQGVIHEQAAAQARDNGLLVVMDRCIKVDHALLLSRSQNDTKK